MFKENSGIVLGPSHEEGGVPGSLKPFNFPVEIEGLEYVLCRQALASNKIYKFKQKTNKEILDFLYKQTRCRISEQGTYVNDFVICKMSLLDDKKRDYKGTASEILSIMQNEHGCNIADGVKLEGGHIEPGQQIEILNSDRWDKKKEHIEKLSGSIKGLRNKVTRDLKSKDEKVKLTAAVIAVMDNTAERVGNGKSKKKGRFGVTGFLKRHLTLDGNAINFKYTGKSSVPHDKTFTNGDVADALRDAVKNSPSKSLFMTSDGFQINADRVNRYLSEYDVTAKDLRGFRANSLIIKRLEKEPAHEDLKKRKGQFRKALKFAAGKVGHGPATLKKHYLIPELGREFIFNSKIIDLNTFYSEGGAMKKPEDNSGDSASFENSEKLSKFTSNINKDELQNVISGTNEVINGSLIQTTLLYLRREEGAGSSGQRAKSDIQEERLIKFITENNLWYSEELNDNNYIDRGFEQLVYEDPNFTDFVVKTNAGVFYDDWSQYLTNLLLHNYFFPQTSYELIGFNRSGSGSIMAVVRQRFIIRDRPTNLKDVEKFLLEKGFVRMNPKMDVYENKDLEVIIGDLHDGNVLTKDDILYFIDAKFFTTITADDKNDIKLSLGGPLNEDNSITLIGGKSDNMSLADIAAIHNVPEDLIYDQLQNGIKVEMEHTNDPAIAEKIAKDHLVEFYDYYDRLERMEAEKEPVYKEIVPGIYSFKNEFGSFTTAQVVPYYDENFNKDPELFTVSVKVRKKEGDNVIIQSRIKSYPVSMYEDYMVNLSSRGAKKIGQGAIKMGLGGKMECTDLLGPDHIPFLRVADGGSNCFNCRFVYKKGHKYHCSNKYFIKKYEGSELPDDVKNWCSDWYKPNPAMLHDPNNEKLIRRVMADGGPMGEAEELANKIMASLSAEELEELREKFNASRNAVLIQEEAKLNDLVAKRDALMQEKDISYKKERQSVGPEKQELFERRQQIYVELAPLDQQILNQNNIVLAVRNGGDLSSISDKKDVKHENIPNFSNITPDNISFNEETILIDPLPVYIPIINERTFSMKGFVFDAIRIGNDRYLFSTNEFKKKNINNSYAIVTLDQLALVSEYYYIKARALAQKEAEEVNKSREESWDKMPEKEKERFLNQPSQKYVYEKLPTKVKKEVPFETWITLTWQQKEQYHKFFDRKGAKRLVSKLSDRHMYVSYHEMYELFINPEAVMPGRGIANPEVFKYWEKFRDMMNWKIKDIRIQREVLSDIRKAALETSFGESNTDDSLKDQYGILVKRQNGSKIMFEEIEQIRKAWGNVNSIFGNLIEAAKQDNLKISHTGTKYVFASKATGMYIPQMKTIAVSNKFGDIQFNETLAYETAHWIDHIIGAANNKRNASDDYESIAGRIAFTFRNSMNVKSNSDYANATENCFARALEQYFAIEFYGENAETIYSYVELEKGSPYFTQNNYVSKDVYFNTLKPLIKIFFEENKLFFKYNVPLAQESSTNPEKTEMAAEENISSKQEPANPKDSDKTYIPVSVQAFMPESQQVIVGNSGEFKGIVESLANIIKEMPSTGQTEDIDTPDKIAYLHYFYAESDWFILEKDVEREQLSAFGYVILNGDFENAEFGYINIEELKATNKVNLDFYFKPTRLVIVLAEEGHPDYVEYLPTAGKTESTQAQEDADEHQIDANIMQVYPTPTKFEADKIAEQVQAILNKHAADPTSELIASDRYLLELYEGIGGSKTEKDRGIFHQYYTPYITCKQMWDLAYHYGLPKNKILNVCEPSMGTGRMFKFSPQGSNLYGFDTDKFNYQISKLLYPQANLYENEFETAFLQAPNYTRAVKKSWLPEMDLVIGNPPYGDYRGYYSSYMPKIFKRYEFLFVYLGLKLLRKDGLLIFVVSQNFMNNGGMYAKMKEEILELAYFVDAFRLPNSIFTFTEVGTDILIFKKK